MSEFEENLKSTGEEETPEDTSLANSDVTTKYQEAAKIVNSTLLEIVAMVCIYNILFMIFSNNIGYLIVVPTWCSCCGHMQSW
jgi:hypothetical protein